jgi:hypothetical protein
MSQSFFETPNAEEALHIYQANGSLFHHFYQMPNKLPFLLVPFAALRHK